MQNRPVRLTFHVRYAILVSVLSAVLMAAACFWYTSHVDHEREADERKNDQQWCELIMFYDNYYTKNPPTNELQKQQAALMHARRVSLGCPIE